MRQMAEDWDDLWPQWQIYFAVADCEASAEQTRRQGGRIIIPPTHHSEIGHLAVLQDPQGAPFAIVEPTRLD